MSYSWNKPLENLPEEMTIIWSCVEEECKSWIRDSFSFKEQPVCPLCKTSMISSVKILPILISSDQEIKLYRKRQRAAEIS
ncbi:cold-shock protein [Paenibacillus aurantius]|uniref:Cold-shock protein n=1 Tax=Paenibacillus aurantius TaxID=2918900 RepID=A0AA96LC42_9BACL|nr:cold-shock protein [Paenibacillus aurantius]WNQ10987.1 cold-shock protein [Paenibacillus aurantius]